MAPVIEETTGESVAKETEESPGADRQFKDAAHVRRNKLNSQFIVVHFARGQAVIFSNLRLVE